MIDCRILEVADVSSLAVHHGTQPNEYVCVVTGHFGFQFVYLKLNE
jgi:hypothetical protein